MKYREMLNPDSLYADLKGLEQWVKQTDQPMDRAILHSLIAGIYADYAASNQWQLRQRTEIVDQTPATDMREWTANMFIEKVRTNIKGGIGRFCIAAQNVLTRLYSFCRTGGNGANTNHHDMYHYWLPVALKHCNGWKN